MILTEKQKTGDLIILLNRCPESGQRKVHYRMDGDDICLPERFAAEYETLETEKTISIVSTDRQRIF